MNDLIVANSEIYLPSPYLFTPPAPAKQTPPIVECLAYLTDPPDFHTDPYWKTDLGQVLLIYRSFVVCEFVRITFDKRVDVMQFCKRDGRLVKQQVKLEAELWRVCWELIGVIQLDALGISRTSPTQHPAVTLLHLILEGKLMCFVGTVIPPDSPETAGRYIKTIQNQNRALPNFDAENPFDIGSFTGQFIDHAKRVAERSGLVSAALSKVVKARMQLTTCWRNTYPVLHGAKAVEKRGRKRSSK